MNNSKDLKTISVPQKLFYSMFEAQKKLERFANELEDFLFSSDKEFIKKMEKAHKEHSEGKVRDFQELKQELE